MKNAIYRPQPGLELSVEFDHNIINTGPLPTPSLFFTDVHFICNKLTLPPQTASSTMFHKRVCHMDPLHHINKACKRIKSVTKGNSKLGPE